MWIESVPYEHASPKLQAMYDRVRGPDGQIDNVLKVHSLRPHTLEGHMALYKAVLHHSGNSLPVWQLEVIGICVSLINGCDYCVEHHYTGLKKQLDDDERARAIRDALESGDPERVFDGAMPAMIRYAVALTRDPESVSESLIQEMCDAGLDDGQIFEVNQVAGYFAYANRTVLGLGVLHENETLGLSPSDKSDTENWTHR